MFRLKRQQQVPVLPLPVRRLWTVGASGSIALSSYILVGYCISQVAGAATIISVIISTVMAIITGLAYVELTHRTQVTGSPYSFCYTYLGELPAFFVGWAVVGECIVGTALMGKAVTYYSDFLTGNQLLDSLRDCCSLGGNADPRLWSFFDPVALSAVVIVGVVCAINSNLACKINQGLLLVNFITVIVTIVYNMAEGSTDNWHSPSGNESIFVPDEFKAIGVFKASGIYMHVFLTLATTATLATQHRGARPASAISMVVTAIAAIIAIIKAASVSLLQPYDRLDKYTPVATFMKNVTNHDFHWVANVNCLGAIVASTAGILSMLVLSANTLEQMVSDGLLWSKLASRRPAISPATTTLLTTAAAAIGAALQDYEGLILCLSSGTFFVFQALLIAVMVSRSHASRETALLIVLKFTWFLYFFVSPGLVIITNRFGELPAQSAVQGVLSGLVLLFLQLAINWHQLGIKVVTVQVGTSVVMGFSSYLMYQLDNLAWYRLYIWTVIGVLIYTLYGYRKSHLGRGIVDLAVVPEEECIRTLEEGLDNVGFQHEMAELGFSRLRRTQRSIGGHSYASARSRHKESFHSAREEDLRRQSFRSIKDNDERRVSFKSFSESFKSSRQPSLAVQSISSGEQSVSSPPDTRDAPDGGNPVADTLRRLGANRDSFKSIRSDGSKRSFQSIQSDDEQGGARAVVRGGRRSRFTSDSWKSASSGDSQRSTSSGRRRPGAASRVSPPSSARAPRPSRAAAVSASAAPAQLTDSPPTSRLATAADLTRTPPSSRRTVAADLVRTPPQTPRGRGEVEILINPRRLCEEIYQTSAAPPQNTATVATDPLSRPGPSGMAGTGSPRITANTTSVSMNSSNPVKHPSQPRVTGSESTSSSDSEWDSEGVECRRYSEADIEAVEMSTSGSEQSVSSDSSGGGPRRSRTPLTAASNSQAARRLPDLGLGDFAPVPRGKRSLSMSDISYDDDESDTAPAMRPRRRPEKGSRTRQPAAHAVKEEKPAQNYSQETADGIAHRLHGIPQWTEHSDVLAQSSPKIASNTQSPLHQTLPNVLQTRQADKRTVGDPDGISSSSPGTSSASTASEDENDNGSLPKMSGSPREAPNDAADAHAITSKDLTVQDIEDQIRRRGLLAEQGYLSWSSSESSAAKHLNLQATDNRTTEPVRVEHRNSKSPGKFDGDDCSDENEGLQEEQAKHEESEEKTLPSNSDWRNRVPSASNDKKFSAGEYTSDESTSRERRRSDSEESTDSIEESLARSHSEHSNYPGSESESSNGTSMAVADDVFTSSDSDSNSPPHRRDLAAAEPPESLSGMDDDVELAAHSNLASLSAQEPTGDEDNLRPIVRRQMRLPHVPAGARWLRRNPTPPDLLDSVGVSDGPRLALGRNASLPDLFSSSSSDSEIGNEQDVEFSGHRRRLEHDSDDRGHGEESLRAQSLPDVSNSTSGEEESLAAHRRSLHDNKITDNSGELPMSQTRPDLVNDRSENKGQEQQQVSDSGSEHGGVSSPALIRRPRPVSENSEDGSPVALRRRKEPALRLIADHAMSLKGLQSQPRSPVARLGSLPPLNPQYRAIYRPAEQPSFALGAGRWRPAIQQARETFIHAESDDERAESFEVLPLEPDGLRVRPELERLSLRTRNTGTDQLSRSAAATDALTTASPCPGPLPDQEHGPIGQGDSPEVIFC